MSGQVIKQGKNWLIVDFLSKEIVDFAKEACEDVYKHDFSEFTTAKGKNSNQYYFKNPSWMPIEDFKESEKWPQLCKKFTDIVQKQIVYHNRMPGIWTELTAESAWTVSGEEGSYHTIHDHGDMKISTVTYLDVPPSKNHLDGQIFFILDGDGYNPLAMPDQRVIHINPQPGMIVIFPSWILHGVYPQGPGLRRTLNIDFGGTYNLNFDKPTIGGVSFR